MDISKPPAKTGPFGLSKTCSRCRLSKDISQFKASPANRTGYGARCLKCSASHSAWLKTQKGRDYIARMNTAKRAKRATS